LCLTSFSPNGTIGLFPSQCEIGKLFPSRSLVLDDYVSRLKRSGFARVDIEKHPEAAHKMVEVSGAAPPPGIEHLLSVNITATK